MNFRALHFQIGRHFKFLFLVYSLHSIRIGILESVFTSRRSVPLIRRHQTSWCSSVLLALPEFVTEPDWVEHFLNWAQLAIVVSSLMRSDGCSIYRHQPIDNLTVRYEIRILLCRHLRIASLLDFAFAFDRIGTSSKFKFGGYFRLLAKWWKARPHSNDSDRRLGQVLQCYFSQLCLD